MNYLKKKKQDTFENNFSIENSQSRFLIDPFSNDLDPFETNQSGNSDASTAAAASNFDSFIEFNQADTFFLPAGFTSNKPGGDDSNFKSLDELDKQLSRFNENQIQEDDKTHSFLAKVNAHITSKVDMLNANLHNNRNLLSIEG